MGLGCKVMEELCELLREWDLLVVHALGNSSGLLTRWMESLTLCQSTVFETGIWTKISFKDIRYVI